MKKVNIGLVGAGTVGKGLLQIIRENRDMIRERTDIDLNIISVCDKNPDTAKNIGKASFTDDYKKITQDPEIDIVVELIGGTGVAYEVVKDSLLNKKTVVTANKALLSQKGQELFSLARQNQVEIGFEASVGGAIPVIRSVKSSLVSNEYEAVYGILNGTTNFILTKMEQDKLDYAVALKQAQDLGFAEADPTFDVGGLDAAHKLSVLGGLAFNKVIPVDKIYVEGITSISSTEIVFANLLGYRIKLLGICRAIRGKLEARVHPVMIPLSHPLSNVSYETNAIFIKTNYSGPTILIGKGAGSLPTASAVVSDLVFYGSRRGLNLFEKNIYPEAEIEDPGNTQMRYYFRFNTVDKPGVLSEIARVLGSHEISISSVRQNEVEKEPVEVVVLSHRATEKNVLKAVAEIDRMKDIIREKTVLLRLEDHI